MTEMTKRLFAQIALKKIEEGRLAIQNEDGLLNYFENDPDVVTCRNTYPPNYFDGKVCHCIIGTALDMPHDDVSVGWPVRSVAANGSFSADQPTLDWLMQLQEHHDALATSLRDDVATEDPSDQAAAKENWLKERDEYLAEVKAELQKHAA